MNKKSSRGLIELDSLAGSRVITSAQELRTEFSKALKSASAVWIATAWARDGWVLDELSKRGLPVNAVIGRSFSGTTPDAIERLVALGGDIRIVPDGLGVFHPKMYLFERQNGGLVILGSANMTEAAFHSNVELSIAADLVFGDTKKLVDTWHDFAKDTEPMNEESVALFRQAWDQTEWRSCEHMAIMADAKLMEHPEELSPGAMSVLGLSWRAYEKLLRSMCWENGEKKLGVGPSWLETIETVQPLLSDKFPLSGTTEFNHVIGRAPKDGSVDYGWFGRLTASGNTVTKVGKDEHIRSKFKRAFISVRKAKDDDEVVDEAKKVWNIASEEKGLGPAVITRFLTLLRPDRFFSVNNKSLDGLGLLLGCPKSRLKQEAGYCEALRLLWSTPWYRSTQPSEKVSRQIWDARVALLDVLVYL